ncbi:hypothetical protein Tco_0936321, partial [Tanacetum coccineum]
MWFWFWDNLCAYDCYVNIIWVCPIVNALVGRLLGAYNLGVVTPRAVVHAGDKTSGDARSWHMISGDAKIDGHNAPRMTTRVNGRPVAVSEEGGNGVQVGGQGGQVGGQGTEVNDGVDGVPDFSTIIAQHLQNLLPIIFAQIELVQDMSGCKDNQKVKYTAGSFVGKALTWKLSCGITSWSGLAMLRIMIDSMSWLGMVAITELSTIQKVVQIASTLTGEALRNGSIKKNPEKRGNRGEPSKDRNGREDNKRTRTGNAFDTTAN